MPEPENPQHLGPIHSIPLENIDGQDRTFATSFPWQASDLLKESIANYGVLTPLLLRSPRVQIVQGFKRFEVARKLGLDTIPAVVIESGRSEDLFEQALSENLASRSFSDLEKAEVVAKLKEVFGRKERSLIDSLPGLGVKADRRHLSTLIALAHVPEQVKRAVDQGLDVETAIRISRMPTLHQMFYCEFFGRIQLGRNKQRAFFELFDEIGSREDLDPDALWDQLGCAAIENREGLSPSDKWHQIHRLLHRNRYPRLAQSENRLEKYRSELRLPRQVQLIVPRNFEGDSVTLTIRATDQSELVELSGKVQDLATSPQIRGIFELL